MFTTRGTGNSPAIRIRKTLANPFAQSATWIGNKFETSGTTSTHAGLSRRGTTRCLNASSATTTWTACPATLTHTHTLNAATKWRWRRCKAGRPSTLATGIVEMQMQTETGVEWPKATQTAAITLAGRSQPTHVIASGTQTKSTLATTTEPGTPTMETPQTTTQTQNSQTRNLSRLLHLNSTTINETETETETNILLYLF